MPLTPGPRTKRVRRTRRPTPINPNVNVIYPAKARGAKLAAKRRKLKAPK